MAPPIIRCYDFSRADGHPPWVAEIRSNRGFSRIFKNLLCFLINFDEHMVQCAPTQHPSSCEARVWRPSVSVSRFPARMHVLDSLGPIPNRFSDFYFSTKIKIFENPWNSMIWAVFGYPRWMSVSSREIITYDDGRRHRRPRGGEHVRWRENIIPHMGRSTGTALSAVIHLQIVFIAGRSKSVIFYPKTCNFLYKILKIPWIYIHQKNTKLYRAK